MGAEHAAERGVEFLIKLGGGLAVLGAIVGGILAFPGCVPVPGLAAGQRCTAPVGWFSFSTRSSDSPWETRSRMWLQESCCSRRSAARWHSSCTTALALERRRSAWGSESPRDLIARGESGRSPFERANRRGWSRVASLRCRYGAEAPLDQPRGASDLSRTTSQAIIASYVSTAGKVKGIPAP